MRYRRKYWRVLGLVALCSISMPSTATEKISLDGIKRSYLLIQPLDTVPQRLIVALHGAGDRNRPFARRLKLQSMSNQLSASIVVPQAKHGNWEEGCECNKAARLGIDDLGYFDAMVADANTRIRTVTEITEPLPVFLLAYSQGGMYGFNLACKRANTVRGALIVAATLSQPLSRQCKPDQPVSLIMINGKRDRVMPYKGIAKGRFATLSAGATFDYWAAKHQCRKRDLETISSPKGRKDMQISAASQCKNDQVVELISLEKGGHQWPNLDVNALLEYLFSKSHSPK